MQIDHILAPEHILLDEKLDCSKAVFRCVAERVADRLGIQPRLLLNALSERERLGSTAVGGGISIPHARLAEIESPSAFFIRANPPVDMDAPDGRRVDLFFVLMVPDSAHNDHLRILSKVAKVLRNPDHQDTIRHAANAEAVLAVLRQAE